MKKWETEIVFAIQAETREKAWEIAKEIIEKHHRGLANIIRIALTPWEDDETIAVNEPIRKQE